MMESLRFSDQSYFDLPPDTIISDLLRRVEAGEISPKFLSGNGLYNQVFSIGEGSGLVLKVLNVTPTVEKALQKGAARYGNATTWVGRSTLLADHLKATDERSYTRLIQLVLQHEMYSRFLEGNILPKKFAIVSFPGPILGRKLSTTHVQSLNKSEKIGDQSNQPMIILPTGMEGKVITFATQSGMQSFFVRFTAGEPTDEYYPIAVQAGEHVVEIQKIIPFGEKKQVEVIANGVFDYLDSADQYEVWEDQFIDEFLNFVSSLITMLIAGVSIDSAYAEKKNANFIVILECGKKRIVTYDTNNWEVSWRYREALTTIHSGVPTTDPFPGVYHAFVDEVLTEKLISPLLEKLATASQGNYVMDTNRVQTFLNEVRARLLQVTADQDQYQAVEKVNEPTLRELEKAKALLTAEYNKEDEADVDYQEVSRLQRQILKLETQLIRLKIIPKLTKKVEQIIESMQQKQ